MGEPRHRAGPDAAAGVWDIAPIERRGPERCGTPRPVMTPERTIPAPSRSIAIGIACGTGAAVFWAAGFVAARHGIDIGFTPADITFHRCFWAGFVLLPLALVPSMAMTMGCFFKMSGCWLHVAGYKLKKLWPCDELATFNFQPATFLIRK